MPGAVNSAAAAPGPTQVSGAGAAGAAIGPALGGTLTEENLRSEEGVFAKLRRVLRA